MGTLAELDAVPETASLTTREITPPPPPRRQVLTRVALANAERLAEDAVDPEDVVEGGLPLCNQALVNETTVEDIEGGDDLEDRADLDENSILEVFAAVKKSRRKMWAEKQSIKRAMKKDGQFFDRAAASHHGARVCRRCTA